MIRRLLKSAAVLAIGATLLVSCADGPVASNSPLAPPRFAISDAARGGQPEFFWLAPTVASNPVTSGTFDGGALEELAVEVCALDAAGACDGPALERFTATSLPTPTRLTLDATTEQYALQWLTGRSGAEAGRAYRVSVRRNDRVLGFVDVMLVRNTPALATVDRSRYTGLVAGQQFPVRFRLEQPVARNYVKINEVESNNGVPGDWVELYNTNEQPLDLSGYVFRDDDDSRGYVIPAGTIIPGRGFLVLDAAQFVFGLGAADKARLFAADGVTLADSYEWTAHAATTYGRCPDGTGAFTTTSLVTKGGANDCDVLIRINEIESEGGTPADWIELYNPSAQPVSLAGYAVSDNDNANRLVLPAGMTIAANGYLVLERAQLGFELDASDAVRLYRANGTSLVDSFTWTTHATTTYGRCPDGAGSLVVTTASTKGSANNCLVPTTTVKVNEVESNGGVPGDWVELYNLGASAVDLSGYVFRDNDDTRVPYTLPSGTIIPAGGYLVLEEAQFGFGLGAADAARFYAPGGALLVDSYSWTAHATTTYGRCPNGTGTFVTSGVSTKGTANNCGILALAVKVNEIESDLGAPGDWVELYNTGAATADLSGYVLRDNAATGGYVIPAGTTVAPGAYLVLEAAQFTFDLGSSDQTRLFAPDGTTLIDGYTWTAHATTTYGRCPNGTGDFTTTLGSSKGATNNCPAPPTFFAWPGDGTIISETFGGTTFGGNMSGLAYQASGNSVPGVLWAVRNGPGALFRLVWTGSAWARDVSNDWGAGKLLRYPNGTGDVDAEGVTMVGNSIYVASERNNTAPANSVSRNSILRYDPSATGTSLTATIEWDLTSDLSANGANLGLEGITLVPDAFLTARGFRVQGTNVLYNPADYPDHGDGLFFVGVEATGAIHAYALNHVNGSFTRLATFTSGFPTVMDLSFDRELNQLWAICDNGCEGRSTVLNIDTQTGSSSLGTFVITQRFERPSGMPNLNNEGFAFAPQAECVNGRKPVFWTDDGETGAVSLRRGLVTCTPF